MLSFNYIHDFCSISVFRKISYFLLIMLFLLPIHKIYAEQTEVVGEPYRQVVFVIDCSNSMNSNDKSNIVAETAKMFIDSLYSKKSEVAIITYNDVIIKSTPLTSLSSSENIAKLKYELDSMARYGSTDIGIALKAAANMLSENKKPSAKPLIILFSDGNTDLSYSKIGRTKNDSNNDANTAIQTALEINCPIYTIGLNATGNLNVDYLNGISQQTFAKSYEFKSVYDFYSNFSIFFETSTQTNLTFSETIEGIGKEQSVTIALPGKLGSEVTIIIQCLSPLTGLTVNESPENFITYKSKYYNGIKISNPTKENLVLDFNAKSGEILTITAIAHIGVLPKINSISNHATGLVPIRVVLINDDDNEITDESYYTDLSCELVVSKEGMETQTISLDKKGSEFIGSFKAEKTGNYTLSAK